MKKITKTYLDRLVYGREWDRKEVEFVDPATVDIEDITSFKFIQQSFIIDEGETYIGKEKNISPVYHVGTRLSLEEALNLATDDYTKNQIKRLFEVNNNISICKTNRGSLQIMNQGDMTLDEYLIYMKSHQI